MRMKTAETVTGRDIGRQRLTLGVSVSALALTLRWHPYALARLERDDTPLDDVRRAKIEAALRHVAARRALELRRSGWQLADLPRDLRMTLALYLG